MDIPLNLLLLLGAARSGTSWAAKVFDSHPRVLYRHEPDISLRAHELPYVLDRSEIPRHIPAARSYISELLRVRTVKAVGSRPAFLKDYESPWIKALRELMIAGLRTAELVGPLKPLVERTSVPDFVPRSALDRVHFVLKSVSAGARARLYADALPEARVVFLVRHPGGQVASMLRGASLGKFRVGGSSPELVASEVGRRHGLSVERHEALPLLDQLVWNWVLYHEKVIDDLEGAPNARIARHQDLVTEPARRFRELFAFAGLSWTAQTDQFINLSTRANARSGYYRVERAPGEALHGWRAQLTAAQQQQMRAILRGSAIAQRWSDLTE